MSRRKTLREPLRRRKSAPILVSATESGAWQVIGDSAEMPVYESREAAIRATDLSEGEKLAAGALAAAREGCEPVVLYLDVMQVIRARGQKDA